MSLAGWGNWLSRDGSTFRHNVELRGQKAHLQQMEREKVGILVMSQRETVDKVMTLRANFTQASCELQVDWFEEAVQFRVASSS